MKIYGVYILTIIMCLFISCTEKITIKPGEATFWGIPEGTSIAQVTKIMEGKGLSIKSQLPGQDGNCQYTWIGNVNYKNVIFDEITTFFNDGTLTGIALTAERPFSDNEKEIMFKEPQNLGLSPFKPMNSQVWWATGDYYHMMYGIGETRDGNKNVYIEISRNADTL